MNLHLPKPRHRSVVYMCKEEIEGGIWVKTKFIDGNKVLWYNNQTQEMMWKKLDIWEEGVNFNLQSFVTEYGAAYFVTAITLSLISYTICFLVVTKSGLDLEGIMAALGITGELKFR